MLATRIKIPYYVGIGLSLERGAVCNGLQTSLTNSSPNRVALNWGLGSPFEDHNIYGVGKNKSWIAGGREELLHREGSARIMSDGLYRASTSSAKNIVNNAVISSQISFSHDFSLE